VKYKSSRMSKIGLKSNLSKHEVEYNDKLYIHKINSNIETLYINLEQKE